MILVRSRNGSDGLRSTAIGICPMARLLEWQQLGVKDLQVDPQLPFFVRWLSDPAIHPSANGHQVELLKIVMAGDRRRIDDWLGGSFESVLRDVDVDWTQPNGRPGLVAAVFSTPRGEVHSVTVRVRPALAGLPRYLPGKPAGSGAASYKLSSNENPYPPLPGVLEATARACAQMNRYPDMAQRRR